MKRVGCPGSLRLSDVGADFRCLLQALVSALKEQTPKSESTVEHLREQVAEAMAESSQVGALERYSFSSFSIFIMSDAENLN